MEDEVQGVQRNHERTSSEDEPAPETGIENRENEIMVYDGEEKENGKEDGNEGENQAEEDPNWLDSGGSQFILDSQQLVEALSLCDDLLQDRDENTNNGGGSRNKQPCFGDYAHLGGTEDFKRDLEDCQKLVLDPSNIDLDTPPEFRLSQLVNFNPFILLKLFLMRSGTKRLNGFMLWVFRNLDHRRAFSLGALERLTNHNSHEFQDYWNSLCYFLVGKTVPR